MISTANVRTESPPMEEIQLAREAHANTEAFAELYRRHVTRVYRYHMAHTGNVKDAEDLTSQTFMAALEGIRSFRGDGVFAAWLMGIASRKRALHFRRNRPEVPLEAALHLPTPVLSTDQLAGRHLQMESVARALQQISPDRADALSLIYFSGLSMAEAGSALGKSEAALCRGMFGLSKAGKHAVEFIPINFDPATAHQCKTVRSCQ